MLTVLSFSWCCLWFSLQAEPDEVSFDREVVPVLTKAGCNAGSCHGAAAGRGGFNLSLLGANPALDHRAIVDVFEGRRINLHQPRRSLFLRKPAADLEHGGGQIWNPHDTEAQTIERWIQAGAKREPESQLQKLIVSPEQTFFATVPGKTKVFARAEFSDGTAADVTDLVTFTSVDPTSVRFDDNGFVHVLRPGQHVLLARYMNRVVPVQWTSPLGSAAPNAAWQTDENFVDREVLKKLDELRVAVSPAADDSQWLRRVHLDLTGRLPAPKVVIEFLENINDTTRADQRATMVDQLLESSEYADYWTWRLARDLRMRSFPNERQPLDVYYAWLRQLIQEDRGLDQLATNLLTSEGDSHVVGPANFGRMVRDAREHAELVGRFFAGVRLECANCHDHPLDRWTQDDYHGLAAVFARVQRSRHVGLAVRGEVINLRNNLPATPRIPGQHDLSNVGDHRDQVAAWVLDEPRDLFARVTVNRLWQAMFGRGLVEPVDDLRQTNPATHPELLEQLARDFAVNGFRLRHTLRLLALSQTYARSSEVLPGNQSDDRFYSRSFARPMEPAVLLDAIQDVVGVTEAFVGAHGQRAIHVVDSSLPSATLDALGRCPLVQTCGGSQANAQSLSAQLQLLNGDVINHKLRDPTGRLQRQIASEMPLEQLIREWWIVALSRAPQPDEWNHWTNELAADDPQEQRQRLEDFVWSLLNSREFVER